MQSSLEHSRIENQDTPWTCPRCRYPLHRRNTEHDGATIRCSECGATHAVEHLQSIQRWRRHDPLRNRWWWTFAASPLGTLLFIVVAGVFGELNPSGAMAAMVIHCWLATLLLSVLGVRDYPTTTKADVSAAVGRGIICFVMLLNLYILLIAFVAWPTIEFLQFGAA